MSELQFDKTPWSTIVFSVENSIQNSSHYLFWFSFGCHVVDSLDELKSSRSVYGKDFQKLRDAGREDCLFYEQDHPEFPVQEEGQPRRTESPERGPVSTRKTDRLHDLRLLSSDWRSWYSIGLCCFILCYFSWWQHSGIRSMWIWLLGECSWIPLFGQRFISEKTMTWIWDL